MIVSELIERLNKINPDFKVEVHCYPMMTIYFGNHVPDSWGGETTRCNEDEANCIVFEGYAGYQ